MEALQKSYRTAKVIGFAMAGTLLVYAVLVEVLKGLQIGFAPGISPGVADTMRYIFLGVAAGDFFLIRFLRNAVLSRSGEAFRDPGRPGEASPMISKLFMSTILTYALCESMGLLGFVLFLVGGSPSDYYVFMGMSLLSFIVFFPRYRQWEEWIGTH